MNLRAYLIVEGVDFDPSAFHKAVDLVVGGQVCERRHLSPKSTAQRSYWKSRELLADTEIPEQPLIELIKLLAPMLHPPLVPSTSRVSAQIVAEYANDESPRGYYLSASLVRALAGLGADLDIDVAVKP
jgi:hypothetical protein